ncbi:hypothetical protein HY622_02990 [Candidatus Uhrbacteria bacterium]|nr:hypothetical protein [Candidatus Uhrbacteria bacterium]
MPDGKTQRPNREVPLGKEREKVAEGKEVKVVPERGVPSKEKKKEQEFQLPKILPGRKKQAPLQTGPKSKLLEDIEDVLAEGLDAYYQSLTPGQRKAFKEEGERTATKIEELFKKAHIKVIEIVRMIRRWLALIPGINQFFIEQESKIKADKLMILKDKEEE